MRHLTKTTALLVLLALAAASTASGVDAAARPRRQCPTVKVSCHDTVLPDSPLPFDAEVGGGAAAGLKLTYRWAVSAGKIVRGQGTPAIALDASEPGYGKFEATVEVGGLPGACARTASCVTTVISDPAARCFDEYGDIRIGDEKARLDNFAIELQYDPTAQGYLLCYGGRVGRAREARVRCERAKDYMVQQRGIEAARLVAVDGGHRQHLTVQLCVVPPGVAPPAATPTVDPSEVKIIRRRAKPRSRRR